MKTSMTLRNWQKKCITKVNQNKSKHISFTLGNQTYPIAKNKTRGVKFMGMYLFLIRTVGGGVQLGPLGTGANNRPTIRQPRVIMMEKLVE
jgi:hypothetical protein